jgi:hypothetical protein
MTKLVEGYLHNIQEAQIKEGGFLTKLLVGIGFGMPNDPQISIAVRGYAKCTRSCWSAYPDDSTTTSSKDASNSVMKSNDQRGVEQEKTSIITTVKKNPERGKCMLLCKYSYIKSVVSTLKAKGPDLCKKNMMNKTCQEWVRQTLPELEEDLKHLKVLIQQLSKATKINNIRQIETVAVKLQKLL